MKFLKEWPLMLRSNHEAVRRENGFLREAIKQANAELLRHRRLIAEMANGHEATTEAFRKATQKVGERVT